MREPVSAEEFEENLTLSCTESAEAPVDGDPMLLHDPFRLDFARPRKRFEDCCHPDAGNDLVFGCPVEEFGEGDRPHLQQLLHFGPDSSGLCGPAEHRAGN